MPTPDIMTCSTMVAMLNNLLGITGRLKKYRVYGSSIDRLSKDISSISDNLERMSSQGSAIREYTILSNDSRKLFSQCDKVKETSCRYEQIIKSGRDSEASNDSKAMTVSECWAAIDEQFEDLRELVASYTNVQLKSIPADLDDNDLRKLEDLAFDYNRQFDDTDRCRIQRDLENFKLSINAMSRLSMRIQEFCHGRIREIASGLR